MNSKLHHVLAAQHASVRHPQSHRVTLLQREHPSYETVRTAQLRVDVTGKHGVFQQHRFLAAVSYLNDVLNEWD